MNVPSTNGTDEFHTHRYTLIILFIWLLGTMLLWLFAFSGEPPASGSSSRDWLSQARAACFGIDGMGLPHSGGWLLLTLAPLLSLTAIMLAFQEELLAALNRNYRSPLALLASILMATLVVAEGVWAAKVIQERRSLNAALTLPFQSGEFPSDYPRGNSPAPDFSLLNAKGERVTLADFRGKNVILTFAFAHCATVCPTLIGSAKRVLELSSPDEIQLLIVTLDPWRDTPKALTSIHKKWELPENGIVLSGSEEEVKSVLDRYGYVAIRDEKTGDVTHPAIVYLIDAEGTLTYTFNNPATEWLIAALQQNLKHYVTGSAST